MKALCWMDRYRKEVIQVSTRKHGINVQYLYNKPTLRISKIEGIPSIHVFSVYWPKKKQKDKQTDWQTDRWKRKRQTDNLLLFDEREEDDQWKHFQQILQILSLDLDHLQNNECFPVIWIFNWISICISYLGFWETLGILWNPPRIPREFWESILLNVFDFVFGNW